MRLNLSRNVGVPKYILNQTMAPPQWLMENSDTVAYLSSLSSHILRWKIGRFIKTLVGGGGGGGEGGEEEEELLRAIDEYSGRATIKLKRI